jgi:hypothetical protein
MSIASMLSNHAFERFVMRFRVRAASALVHCAPAARISRRRAAAQRERYATEAVR